MKKITILLLPLLLTFISCNSYSTEQKAIEQFMTSDGSGGSYDIDIHFDDFKVKNITVADSLQILQQKFEKEKSDKIKQIESSINFNKGQVNKYKKELASGSSAGHIKMIDKLMIKSTKEKITKLEKQLEDARHWEPDYLGRYDPAEKERILVKIASAQVSFMNPVLKVKQKINADFVLNKEGNKCLRMIKKKVQ